MRFIDMVIDGGKARFLNNQGFKSFLDRFASDNLATSLLPSSQVRSFTPKYLPYYIAHSVTHSQRDAVLLYCVGVFRLSRPTYFRRSACCQCGFHNGYGVCSIDVVHCISKTSVWSELMNIRSRKSWIRQKDIYVKASYKIRQRRRRRKEKIVLYTCDDSHILRVRRRISPATASSSCKCKIVVEYLRRPAANGLFRNGSRSFIDEKQRVRKNNPDTVIWILSLLGYPYLSRSNYRYIYL